LCPRLRFTRKARKKNVFCAARFVPAFKVHKKRAEKKNFRASRFVPASKVQTIAVKKMFLRFAPCSRASGSQEKRENDKFPRLALCARVYSRENGFSRFLFAFKVQTKAMRIEIRALRVSCLCPSFTRKAGKKNIALRASRQGIERIVCHAERLRPVQM
jgi:hypothetical protein